jgi:hypothetical protein
MLKQLGLDGLVRAEVRNWQSYLRFGPFVRAQAAESKTGHFVALPAKQATPLIFTSHFFLRLHRHLMPLVRRSRRDIEWVDWELRPNKLPGDINGPMSVVFSRIMHDTSGAQLALGNIRIARFRNSQDGERKPLGQSSR